jgi:hypothetical protein
MAANADKPTLAGRFSLIVIEHNTPSRPSIWPRLKNVSNLIVETVINDIQGSTVENDGSVFEGKTALFEGLVSLGRHIVP